MNMQIFKMFCCHSDGISISVCEKLDFLVCTKILGFQISACYEWNNQGFKLVIIMILVNICKSVKIQI